MSLSAALAEVFSKGMLWSFPALAVVIAALGASVPSERKRLAAAGVLVVSSAAGLLLAVCMLWLGVPAASLSYRVVHGTSCLLVSISAINASSVLLFDLFLPSLRLNLPAILQDLVRAAAYLGAAFTILSSKGANLAGLLATSAVMTAIVAFSLQDTLGNILGGMVLQLESRFAPGDWIRFGEVEGSVREIRWRQTTLETFLGNTFVIPNSALMKGTVTVLGRLPGRPPRRMRKVPFSVYYDRTPDEVIGAVEGALRADRPSGVAEDPAPDCILADFHEDRADYAVRYCLDDVTRGETVDSAVRMRIFYALSRAGIKLSIPSRSLVITQKDQEVREGSLKRERERRLSALKGIDIFQPLNEEELSLLSERLKPSPFAPGETITRQGAAAHWLYILYRGEAEVRLYPDDGGEFKTVARLHAGDFLGEMGLITGEPRSATVVALSEVDCYRLDRESFGEILTRRPQIAEAISALLAERRLGLDAARGGLDEEARRRRFDGARVDLLSRIRSFFSLG